MHRNFAHGFKVVSNPISNILFMDENETEFYGVVPRTAHLHPRTENVHSLSHSNYCEVAVLCSVPQFVSYIHPAHSTAGSFQL